jgi:acetoacetyl-CoA synthetase
MSDLSSPTATDHVTTDAPHASHTPAWTPATERMQESRIVAFARWLKATGRAHLDDPVDYAELQAWSADQTADFWAAVADFFDVPFHDCADTVLASTDMPGASWFPGATLHIVERLLGHRDDGTAIIYTREQGESEQLSHTELRRRTAALADHLRAHGVRPGDRVVGYLPHGTEAIVGFLGTAAVGAVWAVCAQDYSAPAAAARFGQLEPMVLLCADGYTYAGRVHDRREEAEALRAALPNVRHTVYVDHVGLRPTLSGSSSTATWETATSGEAELVCEVVPFDHPLWVLFTSGTTGLPKGIVHGHGGALLEQLVFSGLHFDLGPEDVFFWFTSPNWVMWNILVGGLAQGCPIVVYDGSPTFPDSANLWRVVADHRVTVFGTSPGYLQASERAGLRPGAELPLDSLRIIGSTGSVLAAGSVRWVAEHVGADVQVASVSGGTDICGGFVGSAPTTPTWPGEISAPALGVALEARDEAGRPVVDVVGEMVITKPMPSMPLYLWGDAQGERYRETYFSQFPGAWCQGDWITITPRGTVVMHGRSDSTLNRNGVRLGSADIYDALADVAEIRDCLVLGVEESDGSYWMPLFVVLTEGVSLDEALRQRIRAHIREHASPRHVPDEIIVVGAIPRTRTGKKLEVPLKRLMQGADAGQVLNPDTLEDPAAVTYFAELAQRRCGPAGS